MIQVRCSSCGKTFKVAEQQAGQSVPCKFCTQPVPVEIISDFAEFAAPAPRYDPRAALRQLDEQLERERQMWVFLLVAAVGSLLGAGTAVDLQPDVESYWPSYLGAFFAAILAGGAVPILTTFMAAGGGRAFKSLFGALPQVKDPAAMMRVVTWVAVLGFVCGSAAGAATGVAAGNKRYDKQNNPLKEQPVDAIVSLVPAYLGAVVGVLPALGYRWRAGKRPEAGKSP